MSKRSLVFSVFMALAASVSADGYEPMPLDTMRAVENRMFGFALLRDDTIATGLRIDCPSTAGHRPKGAPDDPDYATFGSRSATIQLKHHNLSDYNFIEAEIYPAKPNTGIVNMNLRLDTDEPQPVGAHLWNLRPGGWNRVICQLTDYRRRNVRSLTLYTDLKGSSLGLPGGMTYYIRNVRLQRRGGVVKTSGWQPPQASIVYSHSGYLPQMRKRAIVDAALAGKPFVVTDAQGRRAFRGKVARVSSSIGDYGVCDFSRLTAAGEYRIAVGGISGGAFRISPSAYVPAMQKVVNYISCQRCGYEVKDIHSPCHADVFADHGGRSLSYGGGWHDAGDLSQQTLQTAGVAFALMECYRKVGQSNPVLAARLLDEARWGMRFVLQTRFGDGFRASSMGMLHWTDGIAGTADDIHTVRTQNNAFDNFLYAACEAYAADALPLAAERDTMRGAAIADYAFALGKYRRQGVDIFPHMMEHTYNTSPSLFMAGASWASSMMFSLTGDTAYAARAREFISYVLRCQETGEEPVGGYFYRDTTRRAIVHFIHQSRGQLFAEALVALCRLQPAAPEKPQWERAIARYSAYMKFLARYAEPYGMFPSGVYQKREYADSVGFGRLHLFAPADARERYDAQLHQSLSLGGGKYLRRFPIWFGIFNGNNAVLLSSGKAAAVLGGYLHDADLVQIAANQATWVMGLNPFGQSMIYGEGRDYPSMDSFSSGEIMGEMPVGIRSLGDSDEPYWPMVNNACYKEVWTTSAGKMLSLLAALPAYEGK